MTETAVNARRREEMLRQTIKWTVYSLLLLNWSYYILDDWQDAQFTVAAGDSVAEWMNAFATSLDELAWFTLLFLFEAETYWLDKPAMTPLKRFLFVLVRFACYLFLAHTVYAYFFNYFELAEAVPLAVSGLCGLAGDAYSLLRNHEYALIDAGNCGSLSAGGQLFQIGGDRVVTDAAGMAEMRFLYVVDIEDAIVWLSVVLLIELVVYLQENGVAGGTAIRTLNLLTNLLYAVLICNALIWLWKGHYVYAWDELLWIGGFAVIGMNLAEWRDDLNADAVQQ